MTITIEVPAEVEVELARRAAAQGRPVEAYAASLLEEAVHVSASARSGQTGKARNLVELFTPLRGLFADGELDFSRNPSVGRHVDLS